MTNAYLTTEVLMYDLENVAYRGDGVAVQVPEPKRVRLRINANALSNSLRSRGELIFKLLRHALTEKANSY